MKNKIGCIVKLGKRFVVVVLVKGCYSFSILPSSYGDRENWFEDENDGEEVKQSPSRSLRASLQQWWG